MSRFHSLFVVIYTRHFVIHCCIIFAVIFGLCFVLGNCRTAAVDDCCHMPFSFPCAHHPMRCQAVIPGSSLCSVQSALVRGCCANPCIFRAVVASFPVLFSVRFYYNLRSTNTPPYPCTRTDFAMFSFNRSLQLSPHVWAREATLGQTTSLSCCAQFTWLLVHEACPAFFIPYFLPMRICVGHLRLL